MGLTCTRCQGTGFLNLQQVDAETLAAFEQSGDELPILAWIACHMDSDVQVCDCCGDGQQWYGARGEHAYNDFGERGPYASNGGLPQCH